MVFPRSFAPGALTGNVKARICSAASVTRIPIVDASNKSEPFTEQNNPGKDPGFSDLISSLKRLLAWSTHIITKSIKNRAAKILLSSFVGEEINFPIGMQEADTSPSSTGHTSVSSANVGPGIIKESTLLETAERQVENAQEFMLSSTGINDISMITSDRFISIKHLCHHDVQDQRPCVIYVPGFLQDATSEEASFIMQHCTSRGYECITYSPEGLGSSSGKLLDVAFEHWLEDCEAAMSHTTNPKVCLVGWDVGGLIAVRTAMRQPRRVRRLVLLAPGLNMLSRQFARWYREELTAHGQYMVDEGLPCLFQSEWGVMPVRKSFFIGATKAELDLRHPVAVVCPTTIVHGMRDELVDFKDSIKLMLQVNTKRVNLVLRKDSGHRMTKKNDLDLVGKIIDDYMQ